PLFELSIRTPRVELRYPDDELATRITALSLKGVHDPGFMPFSIAWTDQKSPQLERSGMQHYWKGRAELTADNWSLPFVVLIDGEVVGVQDCAAKDFAKLRVASTGSWLGVAFQGQGIGKEMRSAVVHFAFAGLGA